MKKLPKSRDVMMALAAQWRYCGDESLTLDEIGRRLGIKKATVSRLLKEAREQRLVSVSLNLPREQELEIALQQQFALADAAVFPIIRPKSVRDRESFRTQLASSAARYLEGDAGPIKPGASVGISCGASIREIINALTPSRFTDVRITQLTVETEVDWYVDQSPFTLVGMLAAKWSNLRSDGEGVDAQVYAVHPLPDSLRDANGWTKEYVKFREVIEKRAKSLDVALVGIGSCSQPEGVGSFARILSRHGIEISALTKLGVVGEICNRVFTADGRDKTEDVPGIQNILDGISPSCLQELIAKQRKVIAVAGGAGKLEAIRAALSNGFVNVVVTDTETAAQLVHA